MSKQGMIGMELATQEMLGIGETLTDGLVVLATTPHPHIAPKPRQEEHGVRCQHQSQSGDPYPSVSSRNRSRCAFAA
jgi:hypothetical protein